MRVTLVSPAAFPSVLGNAVTVGRLAGGLRAAGVAVEVADLSRIAEGTVATWLAAAQPDLVHAFHAYRSGPVAAAFARRRGLPLVLSLTGTDANADLFDDARRAVVLDALGAADAVVVFHASIGDKLAGEVPAIAGRLQVIPQAVWLPPGGAYPLDTRVPRAPGEVRFLLPAGIRRVKNVLLPVAALRALAARRPLRLLVAGPVIEAAEGARLVAALGEARWAAYLGEVPHGQMASLLDQVEVVVNSSRSEGGMSNAVLEAMSRGRAVLAADIEGNRSVIEDGVDGLLFGDGADLARRAEALIRDADLRARLGEAARAKVARLYPPEREIAAHLALYRRLLSP